MNEIEYPGYDETKNAIWGMEFDETRKLPRIYMACGTEDSLLEKNRAFHQVLENAGDDVTYEEGSGGHEWDFWDRYIKRVIDWLPLEDKAAGINSGNVGL